MSEEAKKEIGVLILAAGKGTRMKSELAKVLHPVCGRPMLAFVVDAARAIDARKICLVIGHQAEMVRRCFPEVDLVFVEQTRQLGTGHAVLQAREVFGDFTGSILILCGDVPLLRPSTLKSLIAHHEAARATVTVMTVVLDEPGSYGRVLRGPDGSVMRIVEARDATEEEKRIREINTGIYCAEAEFLFRAVARISNNNVQSEYYLTDIIAIAWKDGCRTAAFTADDPQEVMGINTPEDLEEAERVHRRRR